MPTKIRKAGRGVGNAFGVLVKQHREAQGLSQSRTADLAWFDHSYVSRLESGARTPTVDAVYRLSSALGLNETEHDQLLAAAGFLPKDVGSLLAGEPVVGEALEILRDDDIPERSRDNFRQVLHLLVAQIRMTVP